MILHANNNGMSICLDDDDEEIVVPFCWRATKVKNIWYATTTLPRDHETPRILRMHRLLLDYPASPSQNQANRFKGTGTSSQYKGVTFIAEHGTWQAQLDRSYLGRYLTEEEAAAAYDAEARKRFGAFARPNFSTERPYQRIQPTHNKGKTINR